MEKRKNDIVAGFTIMSGMKLDASHATNVPEGSSPSGLNIEQRKRPSHVIPGCTMRNTLDGLHNKIQTVVYTRLQHLS